MDGFLSQPHSNATSKRWHLWEIDLRFALNSTPGWEREDLATVGLSLFLWGESRTLWGRTRGSARSVNITVCYLLYTFNSLHFIVYSSLSVVYCLQFIVCCLSYLYCLLFTEMRWGELCDWSRDGSSTRRAANGYSRSASITVCSSLWFIIHHLLLIIYDLLFVVD